MPPLPDYPTLNNLFLSDPSMQQQQQQQQRQAYGDVDENTEEYSPAQDYDEGEILEEAETRPTNATKQIPTTTRPPASTSSSKPTAGGAIGGKEDQAKKLQDLRAQLMARRVIPQDPNFLPPKEPAHMRKSTPAPVVPASKDQESVSLPPPPTLCTAELERLVAQGQAAAAAQDLKDHSAKTTSGTEMGQHKKLQQISTKMALKEPPPKLAEQSMLEVKPTDTNCNRPNTRRVSEDRNTQPKPRSNPASPARSYAANDRIGGVDGSNTNSPSAHSTDDTNYFLELPEWLEITGYHNAEYRQAKLARYRKMQQLTAEMEKLKQEDPTSFEFWQARNAMPPPPLPQRYTSSNVGTQMATPSDTPPGTAFTSSFDTKRQRSPVSSRTIDAPPAKVPRFEAVDRPEDREHDDRSRRPSSRGLEHRVTGASDVTPRSSGPVATERRQTYDNSSDGHYPPYDRYHEFGYRETRVHDHYTPQHRASTGGRQQQQQQQQQPNRGKGQKPTALRGKRGK